ncbi:MAG: hypothetical protein U5P10_02675 [Spirochaetia bacterium]|nr:hypothetical protein [Spirochaetia bacterium]
MNKQDVDLGFGHTTLPPGTHICQIYNDEDERNEALLKFLSKGIELREKSGLFLE